MAMRLQGREVNESILRQVGGGVANVAKPEAAENRPSSSHQAVRQLPWLTSDLAEEKTVSGGKHG